MAEVHTVEGWRRISVLGAGSFGVVILWKNTKTNEFLAIKMCRLANKSQITPRQRERWHEEVAFMKRINHANIVSFKPLPEVLESVLSQHNPSELPILSMEYCTKGNMRYKLLEPINSCGLLEEDVREVLTDVNEAVSHLHHLNVIHRDIKPENIVLQHSDCRRSNSIYKLIDLGYAKENINTDASFVGTMNYLAPEIFKRERYNVSVDYWSMGILFYEVICGMVPFLPEIPPIERFVYIRKKHPDHISIMMVNNHHDYRKEMCEVNHISPCLKRHIEIWLRHVLQYNSKERVKTFPDGQNVFEHLREILRKKIITLYCLYTAEFHSYDIDATTLIGTLKEWIARDTGVPKDEQILLTSVKNNDDVHDDELVIDLLKTDMNMYLIKRGSFIKSGLKLITPKAVNQLITSVRKSFSWSDLKPLYRLTIHYILQEIKAMKAFDVVFALYVDFVQHKVRTLKIKGELLREEMNRLLIRMDCYDNIRCRFENGKKLTGRKYREILLVYKSLLENIKQTNVELTQLKGRIGFLVKCHDFNSGKKLRAQEIIQESVNLETDLMEAIRLFQRSGETKSSNDLKCSAMCTIVSQLIKKKHKLLIKNEEIQNFTNGQVRILIDAERLLDWMMQCQRYIRNFSRKVDDLQSQIIKLLIQQSYQNTPNADVAHILDVNSNLKMQISDHLDELSYKYNQLCDITNEAFSHNLL